MRRDHPWVWARRKRSPGIVLFEPRMLPVFRIGVTMSVTTRICSIRRWWRAKSKYSRLAKPSQEGKMHDPPRILRPPDVDIERSPLGRMPFLDGCERDPHAQARRHRAARHVADVDSTRKDAVTRPRDSPIVHPHSNEAWIIVARPLRLKRLATNERPAPFHDPGAVHLERRLVSVEVLAGQEEAFLEAKRVPRAEADRLDPEVRPGRQERFPDPQSLRRGRRELEPRIPRLAGAGDRGRIPTTGKGGGPHRRESRAAPLPTPPPLRFICETGRSLH